MTQQYIKDMYLRDMWQKWTEDTDGRVVIFSRIHEILFCLEEMVSDVTKFK